MLLKIRKNCIAISAAVLIALLLAVCAVGLAQNGQVAYADSTPSVRIFWGMTHSGEFIVSDSSGDIYSADPTDGGSFQADSGSRFDIDESPVPWKEHLESIQKVSFKGNVVPVSLSYWFAGCYYLREIDFSGLDTSLVQDMGNMFLDCAMLESLDLSSFNTANVTDMEGMFFGCVGLTGAFGKGADAGIRISNNFTTANVKQMDKMFHNCYGLTEIDLSTFDIALGSGMTMENMFFDSDDSTLSPFAISKIITPNTIADGIEIMLPAKFYDTALEADIIDNSESVPRFILTSVNQGKHELLIHENHNYNSATCLKKEACSVCGDEQGVLNKNNHDVNCGKIIYWNIDGSELVLSRHWHELADSEDKVGSFEYNDVFGTDGAPWYESHAQIAAFSVIAESDEFDVAPASTANWFCGLENLTGVDFNGLNTTGTANMSGMFSGCSSLQTLELNLLNTSNVDNMDGMFSDCSALTSLDLSMFDTVRLRSMKSMFSGCSSMTSVNLSSFSISHAAVDENVFGGCTSLNEITTPVAMGSTQISLAVNAGAHWWNGTQDIEVITNADVNKTIHRHDAHSFGNKVPQADATCTGNGVKAHYVCNICEQKFLEKTDAAPATAAALAIEALGHSGGKATCTEQAKCLVCGEKYGNLVPHTPGTPRSEQIVPANCEKAGSYIEVIDCTECTQEISREQRELPINPGAHFWDEEHRTLEKEATCSETGLWIYTCIFNVQHTQTITILIDPNAHKYGEWTVKIEESCSTTGMRERVCEYCGDVEGDVVPMDVNKHVYGEWIVRTPATCTQDGEKARACVYSVNHKADLDTIPATGHTFGANTVRQAATCTLPESVSGICVTCGEYFTVELAPALGHVMEHFDAKAPTCLEHGWDAYDVCSRCNESSYHEIEKLSHTVVRDNAADPTCTENGRTYGEHCSVCGTVLVEPQVTEAFGHEFGEWIVSEKGSFNDYTQKKRVCLHDPTHVESKVEVGSFNSGWVIPIIIFAIIIAGELAFITVYLVRKYKEKIIGKWQRMKK